MKKYSVILLGTFLVVLLSNAQVYAQDNPERFLRWFVEDPVSMVSDFGTQQLLTVASFGAGVSVISLGDVSTSRNLQRNYGQSGLLNFTNKWGDWKIAAPVSAGIFAASLLTKDSKFQDAAFTSMQALLLTNITVNTGKFIFGRERPAANEGAHDFDFVEGGGTSFPSGHTATAFALVTPWVIYYPGPVTYTLMAIPVGTAVARVAQGKHWLSDVTAGAGIGIAMGYYLSKKHLSFHSDRIQILPSAGSDNFSLTVNFSF